MERAPRKNRSASSLKEATPNLDCLESILGEIQEAIEELEKVQRKLDSQRQGSEAYLDLLPDLLVAACVLESKAHSLTQETEAIIEARPDD